MSQTRSKYSFSIFERKFEQGYQDNNKHPRHNANLPCSLSKQFCMHLEFIKDKISTNAMNFLSSFDSYTTLHILSEVKIQNLIKTIDEEN